MTGLVDHALERTFVMSLVVASALIVELPEDFDGDALADFQAIAVWEAVCNLSERRESIDLWSVRDELETWAGHRELTWFERPSEAWPLALVDIAGVCAERLVRDPASLPIAAWAQTLMRMAATRRELVDLDEDIDVEDMSPTLNSGQGQRTAA